VKVPGPNYYLDDFCKKMMQPQAKITVLIIDDDKFLIKLMAKAIERAGYNVMTASQGKQAIELLSQQSADLIVVDLMMPEMDGLAFLHWLRQEAELNIPTLVQTAMVKSDTEKQVMNAGASALIFKPVKVPDLIARIQELEKLL
jgi:CheY-like chemotaxis protein